MTNNTQSDAITRDPVASVMMITYNHKAYIQSAIEGVLSQRTTFPFELVIGEDCSSDGTREIVLAYAQSHPAIVRVITGDRNVGSRQNSLRTCAACRGQYVAFCEGDDFWHDPNKLQTQIDFLVDHPSYGMVHCNYDTYDVVKRKLRRNELSAASPLQDDQAYAECLLRRREILTLTVCVRRPLLERVVRDNPECTDAYWPMGDTQRWFELSQLAKVKYLAKSMATHNVLANSASRSTDPIRQFRFTERGGELILHYLDKYPIEVKDQKLVRRRVTLNLVAAAYAAGDYEKAASWYHRYRQAAWPIPVEARLYYFGTWRFCRTGLGRFAVWWLLLPLKAGRRLNRGLKVALSVLCPNGDPERQ